MRTSVLVPLLLIVVLSAGPLPAHDEEPPKLLGRCDATQLDEEPYREWFRSGVEDYQPNASIVAGLRELVSDDLRFTIFFGTWCGDSRREVPRMLKTLDALGLSEQVELVALDRTPDALKRSPDGEERGRGIFRVPTLIVERDEREIARLIEHPVLSIERDLLAMLEDDYTPAYPAYPVVRGWLARGLLHDPNVSARGLAAQLKSQVNGSGDLAAIGAVLRSRGELEPAIKIFAVNCELDWESSRNHERLAEALLDHGDADSARKSIERALRYNDDPERLDELAELVRRAGSEASTGD